MDFGLGPSQILLLRAALSPDRSAAAAALAAWWRGIDDFDAVRGTDSALFPQVFWNVGPAIRDPKLAARLKGAARHQWIRNRYLLAGCGEVLGGLSGSGIPTVLIKGAAIATVVDDDPGLRAMSDCDILVPRDCALAALDRLAQAGVIERPRLAAVDLDIVHGLTLFRRPGSASTVDLHWRPLRTIAADELAAEMLQEARPVRFVGHDCLAACPEHLVFHAIVHGTDWSPFPHYAWLVDTVKILRRAGTGFAWDRLVAMARRYHYRALVGAALAEAQRTTGIEVPDAVRLALGRGAAPLERREARLRRLNPSTLAGRDELLLSLQKIRRRSARDLDSSVLRAVPQLFRMLFGPMRPPAAGNNGTEPITLLHGWSAPDATGRWTEGRYVSFAVAATGAQRPAAVRLTGFPLRHDSGPGQVIDAYAGLRHLARLTWSPAGPDPIAQEIPLPVTAWRGDFAVVRLHVRTPVTPIDLGINGDPRPLGLFVEDLTTTPPERDLVAAPLDLTDGGDDAAALWHGWSAPEPVGTWTFGAQATLRWRIKHTVPAGATLHIAIVMVAPGPDPVSGHIAVGSGKPQKFCFGPSDRDVVVDLTLSAGLPAGHAGAVHIAVANPRSPASTTGSADIRPLGLCVARVWIDGAAGG